MSERIGLIGPGKLGLCVALLLEEAGYEVTAVENNGGHLQSLQKKSLVTSESGVAERLKKSMIKFGGNVPSLLDDNVETILIYVPTPDSEHGYDHSILAGVLDELLNGGKPDNPTTVMIGCTTLPGFCQTYSIKLKALNYHLVYSPSFIAQGSIVKNLQNPDILLFGSDYPKAIDRCEVVMKSITKNNPVSHKMDILSAEITKLATNCFLTTKIAFANSIGDLAVKTGANQESVLKAIGDDSRIGRAYLGYGFGFGGPCFPRDNRALNYFAKENDFNLRISDATEASNQDHAAFQVEEFLQKQAPEQVIHFDHVTYKPDTDILDESQQLKVALALANQGRKVSVSGSEEVIRKLKEAYGNTFVYILRKS